MTNPKSLDISKAIDKAAGAKREVLGQNPNHRGESQMRNPYTKALGQDGSITAPATEHAKKWQGYGTALKPASEHWILIRKPLSEKTVAANVLKHGTGGINIDASRVEYVGMDPIIGQNISYGLVGDDKTKFGQIKDKKICGTPLGRFPANLVLSHNDDCDDECSEGCAVNMLDDSVKGRMPQPAGNKNSTKIGCGSNVKFNSQIEGIDASRFQLGGDPTKASRFFYCAKASKSDRGTENKHPTVKSTKLMEYLIKLVTPSGGTVLDPFMGSGSTGVAAKRLGFSFVGIERDLEYFNISKKRIGV